MVKFGLLCKLSAPKPWNERSEYDTCWEAIEQVVLAEELGCDQIMFNAETGMIPHDKILKSLRLFAKEVMPSFKEGAPVARGSRNSWQR